MNIRILKITVLALLCASPTATASDLTKAEIAARDFNFAGVGFGTTLEEYRTSHPGGNAFKEDKAADTVFHVVEAKRLGNDSLENKNSGTRTTKVWFFESQVCQIAVIYDFPEEDHDGVTMAVERRLNARFGKPQPNSTKREWYWHFPQVHRMVQYENRTKGIVVIVTDYVLLAKSKERRAKKVDVGF